MEKSNSSTETKSITINDKFYDKKKKEPNMSKNDN